MTSAAASRIFCAIDTTDLEGARTLARRLAGEIGGIKLGLEFFIAHGPQGVRTVVGDLDMPFFLDLKLHDIPNTVAAGVRATAPLAPAFLTIHTAGGPAMMRAAADAAREAAEKAGVTKAKVLGVTVLTSLDAGDLAAVGVEHPVADQVERLALLARESRLDGVVCSPEEVARLRRRCGPGLTLMVPGIRPAGSAGGDDQKRTLTPAQAVAAGADYLVIGRPITKAPDPVEAARRIVAELEEASS